jgi:hypothetical protein
MVAVWTLIAGVIPGTPACALEQSVILRGLDWTADAAQYRSGNILSYRRHMFR